MSRQESRQRYLLYAPPRSAVRVPGAAGAFGPGFFRRLRESGAGCFLLLFMAVGAALALFGLAGTVGPWKEALRENQDPRFFLGAMAFGTVFFLVPLRMLQVILTSGQNEKRRAKRPADPRQPWASDHPWRPAGMEPDYSADPGGSVLGRVAFLALIGLFNIALASGETFLVVLILAFDLLGLVLLFDSLLKVWHRIRNVRTRMRWTTFPAFLGGRLEGIFTVRPGQHVMTSIQVRLRCVRDEWTERRTQDGRTSALEPYVIYEQSFELLPPGETLDELPLAFDLPADLPGTDLGRNEATYWQVALRIPVTGPDVEAVFLAPVYARAE
jgi:hypothetical protein